ncbi:MAG: hypothetical protein NT075_23725 [Chloroflexi bacterium]|nr:hypothetical protein [Chloroflexota bacterium]
MTSEKLIWRHIQVEHTFDPLGGGDEEIRVTYLDSSEDFAQNFQTMEDVFKTLGLDGWELAAVTQDRAFVEDEEEKTLTSPEQVFLDTYFFKRSQTLATDSGTD